MSYPKTYISPTTVDRLLSFKGMSVDEAKLLLSMTSLNNQMYNIELADDSLQHSQSVQDEMCNLKNRLSMLKNQVESSLLT